LPSQLLSRPSLQVASPTGPSLAPGFTDAFVIS
jgi:hypothetical protein